MSQHYDEPESEAGVRVAQLAAMSVTVLEAIARLRAQRASESSATEKRAAANARAQRFTDHATARIVWSPAFEEHWTRKASSEHAGK